MKGFVPVSKASLAEMVAQCYLALDAAYKEKHKKIVDNYIKSETRRTTVRKWYRLWILPKPRFAYNALDIVEFSGNREYPIFEGCPFKFINEDYSNSKNWIDNLNMICNSQHAGEPIQLDIKTFSRISEPFDYYWVKSNGFFTL